MPDDQEADFSRTISDPPRGWPWSWVDPRQYCNNPNMPNGMVAASKILADILPIMRGLLSLEEEAFPICKYVFPGLTNYGGFGGSASYLSDRSGYAVAVEASSSIQILLALFRLMAEPSTFTSLKSVRQLELKVPLGLPLLPKGGGSEFGWIGHQNIKAPALAEDSKLMGNLRLLHSHALTYLFLHEIAHVIEGHIEFCRETKYKALQMRRQKREEFLGKELQPLEFLADQRALYLGALHILHSLWENPSIERKHEAAIEHLTLFGIAVGIVSLLYEHYSGHSYSHPPASHRALYIQAAVHIDLPQFKLSDAEIQSALNDGIEQASHGWDSLGWPRNQDLPNDVDSFLAPLMDVSSRCVRPQNPPMLSLT
ncbi:hypothetical protein [Bradyrhizobium sp. McL0616]|uniref:hypothetical protein n=1 Tax=Bradyrhizobium sp. McL0616 TaxID=3415674 RepID=UPI003CEB058A